MGKYDDEALFLKHRENKALSILEKMDVPENFKFLDTGCGEGLFLQTLAARLNHSSAQYFGGDYSEYMCEVAGKRTGFTIKPINLEERLDYEDGLLDCVYAGEVIEHLYNPDNMVQEIARVLKPGGYFLLSTPNMNSWISRLLFFFFGMQPLNYECSTLSSLYGYRFIKKIKKQDFPVGHVRLFNAYSLSDILMDNGFEKPRIYGTVFDYMPSKLLFLDYFFTNFPKLASGLVVVAKKASGKT